MPDHNHPEFEEETGRQGERSLLYLLAANAGRVVTRAENSRHPLGELTMSRKAMWWTGRSAICERGFRTTGASRGSSPPCPARVPVPDDGC